MKGKSLGILKGGGLGFAAILALLTTGSLSAETYNLVVHGRSDKDYCSAQGGEINPYGGVNQSVAMADGNASGSPSSTSGYWSASAADWIGSLGNVRYVGWSGSVSGGAWSWETCGARKQFWYALYAFCRNGNVCNVYTHSTGSLVVSTFIAHHADAIAAEGVRINRIQMMSPATGGSELANILEGLRAGTVGGAPAFIISLKTKTTQGVDPTVTTYGARADWLQKNQSFGYRYQTTSGTGYTDTGAITGPLLPGLDDSVLANHSLCNVNGVTDVQAVCGSGNATFRHRFACGFMWASSCYYYYGKYTPYYTILQNGSDHYQGVKYWKNYGTY
ncbi:MAG: hypothetical protein K8S54_03905 [Spirochaetia bacterium]|nr:hypothetical protein [Spirochaetia bacterium]